MAFTNRFFKDRRTFYERKSTPALLLGLTVEKYMTFLGAALLTSAFLGTSSKARLATQPWSVWAVIETIVIWPVGETIVFQWAIIELGKRLKWAEPTQLMVSAASFSLAHYIGGGASHAIFAGAIGGYYLGFIYLIKREASLTTAFITTLTLHVIHNSLSIAEGFVRHG